MLSLFAVTANIVAPYLSFGVHKVLDRVYGHFLAPAIFIYRLFASPEPAQPLPLLARILLILFGIAIWFGIGAATGYLLKLSKPRRIKIPLLFIILSLGLLALTYTYHSALDIYDFSLYDILLIFIAAPVAIVSTILSLSRRFNIGAAIPFWAKSGLVLMLFNLSLVAEFTFLVGFSECEGHPCIPGPWIPNLPLIFLTIPILKISSLAPAWNEILESSIITAAGALANFLLGAAVGLVIQKLRRKTLRQDQEQQVKI